jgi:katanin p60 ATPase-containing subunit A1
MSDLQALKYVSKAREAEEKRVTERRRNVLVLILRHLVDFGYVESYEKLSSESNLSLHKVAFSQFFAVESSFM